MALAADGSTVVATAPLEGTDTTDSFQYTVTDAAGEAATATVSLTVTAPAAPPPQAQGDQATTNQGQAVTVAVLGNDLDPLGRGLTVTSVGATPGRVGDDRRQQRHVHARTPTSSGRRRSSTASATAPTPPAARPRRRSPSPSSASRRHRARPIAREGNATATVTWAAPPSNGAPIDDYELRIEGGVVRQRRDGHRATRGTA